MVATETNSSKSNSKYELLFGILLSLFLWALPMNPWLVCIIWIVIGGLSGHLIYNSHWTKESRSETAKILSCIGIAALISWQALDILKNDKQQTSPMVKLSEKDVTPAVTISCHCDRVMSPIVMPADKVIYWHQLNPLAGEGLGEAYTADNYLLLTSSPHQSLYRCRVENDGIAPIRNVRMALHMRFTEAVRDSANPSTTRSGNTTFEGDWTIPMHRIDVGPSGFVFYISNLRQQFVMVTLPQFVTYQRANSETNETVRLMQPQGFFMSFEPIL